MIEKHHVIITNRKHPHHGRRGYIEVCNGKVTVLIDCIGRKMVRIAFTGGDPEFDAAMAYPGDFQPDPLPAAPPSAGETQP